MATLPLYRDANLVLEKISGNAIVVARRTPTEPDAKEVRALAETVNRVLEGIDRHRHGLLVDLRPAKLRSGPDLDAALEAFRESLVHDFAAVARLVATSVGVLQGQRTVRNETGAVRSFLDEDQALAWLRERVAEKRASRG